MGAHYHQYAYLHPLILLMVSHGSKTCVSDNVIHTFFEKRHILASLTYTPLFQSFV